MRNFILTLLLFASSLSFSQSQLPPCSSDAVLKNLIERFPETKERLAFFEKSLIDESKNHVSSKSSNSIPPAGTITIPIVVYIVHDGTVLTNISDAQVTTQITALNDYFLNTGIKFCLATMVNGSTSIPTVNATDVQSTPGIIHVNNPSVANTISTAPSNLVATASPAITRDRYLRIWVVKSIDGPNSGIAGYSMFPNMSPSFDGIVMRYNVFGNGNPNMLANYNLGKVLVHEAGHYLGLYHTFEGSCSNYFNDCTLDGDHVCDTPAVATPNFNCISGTNSCTEIPAVLDDLSNYMDYGNNFCQSHFSNGQIERMLSVLNTSRSTLPAAENIIFTATCGSTNLLSATITASDYSPCATATAATIFNAPNATTYLWNFGDSFATGSNPNTATTQTASHIYTSAVNSPYTVTLTVTNSVGETRTSSELIYVTNCTPIANSNSYWYVDASSGLNFSSGKAVFDSTFPYNHFANFVCNSQCDSNGNLLFYASGQKVYNNQHVQINTTDLTLSANGDSSNKMLIVPKPSFTGNPLSQYYIFEQQSYLTNSSDAGFRYNIVNVSGSNAVMGATNQIVTLPASYGFDTTTDGALLGQSSLTAIKKCDSNDYWILTILKKGTTPYFVVFSLTSSGLAYQSETAIPSNPFFVPDYDIEMAPNGNKLFIWHGGNSLAPAYIFDFNKAEGFVDSAFSAISLPQTANTYGQMNGCSFSPDSNLLYTSDYYLKKIYQYNLNAIDVSSTRKQVASLTVSSYFMQLGPDKKLYVAMFNDFNNYQQLSVIHNPNAIVTTENPNACGFSLNGPETTSFTYRVGPGLPNIIDANQETAYFSPNTPNVISKYITGCNTYKFFPNVCGTSFVWTFTNTTTGNSFTSTVTDPTYNFSQNGTYIVTLKDTNNVTLGTSSPIVISSSPTSVINGSTTACLTQTNANITNNSTFVGANETLTWSITGGTGTISGLNNQPSVNINWTALPGTITLTKTDAAGCTNTTTKTITTFCQPLSTDSFANDNVKIVPNPSDGLFTISSSTIVGKVNIQVVDIQGRIVYRQNDIDFGNSKTIDLSGCASALYILKIEGPEFWYSQKIIKK